MDDLSKYDIDCSETKRPVYEKRYAKDGSEYLEKVDEIDIEEDLKEKKLEITRLKEIIDTQKRMKAEDQISQINEQDLNDLKGLTISEEMDTYEFLNKTNQLKEFYNKMPENIKKEYRDLSRFGKEYLPKFINEKTKQLQQEKEKTVEIEKQNVSHETFEELQKQITELKEEISYLFKYMMKDSHKKEFIYQMSKNPPIGVNPNSIVFDIYKRDATKAEKRYYIKYYGELPEEIVLKKQNEITRKIEEIEKQTKMKYIDYIDKKRQSIKNC